MHDADVVLARMAALAGGFARLTPGLTIQELTDVERRYGFIFPPDLASFLRHTVPIGTYWPDWRDGPEADLARLVRRPKDDLMGAFAQGLFWWPGWGEQSSDESEDAATAWRELALVPPLIPVYLHRYLPSEPREAGNPIISWYFDDAIVIAADLESYFRWELDPPARLPDPATVRRVAFWSELIKR